MDALVLRLTPYKDTDLVVQLLARGLGRVSAFARGARASKKRFAGALEPFQLLDVELEPGRGELSLLQNASVKRAFLGLRADLGAMAHAGYAAELAREMTRDHEPADALLALSIAFLEVLDARPATSAELRALELGALDAAGFAPELSRCARCGGELPASPCFDADAGGLACLRCARPGAPRLAPAAADALRVLQSGGLTTAAALPPVPLENARNALRAFIAHHVGRRLRSVEFMSQVGADL